jgi:hypothetical protein
MPKNDIRGRSITSITPRIIWTPLAEPALQFGLIDRGVSD